MRIVRLLALVLLLVPLAFAQDYDSMSLEELTQAAREEGEVVVYSFTSRIFSVEEAFEAAYPGIDLVPFDISSTEQIARIRAEMQARVQNADIAPRSSLARDIVTPAGGHGTGGLAVWSWLRTEYG